jgi:hypothetical protein
LEANLNDYVWVILTEDGIGIYNEYFRKLGISERNMVKLKTNQHGETRFQIWELMGFFGNDMFNGSPKQPFKRNRLFFSEPLH